jgi:hypothetical protein
MDHTMRFNGRNGMAYGLNGGIGWFANRTIMILGIPM